MPLPLLCMRPMVAKFYRDTRLQGNERKVCERSAAPRRRPDHQGGGARRHHRRPPRLPALPRTSPRRRAACRRRPTFRQPGANGVRHAPRTGYSMEEGASGARATAMAGAGSRRPRRARRGFPPFPAIRRGGPARAPEGPRAPARARPWRLRSGGGAGARVSLRSWDRVGSKLAARHRIRSRLASIRPAVFTSSV